MDMNKKSISLFFILAILVFLLGFLSGIQLMTGWKHFAENRIHLTEGIKGGVELPVREDKAEAGQITKDPAQTEEVMNPERETSQREPFSGFLDVSSLSGVLGADTEYVVKEKDILRGTEVETTLRLPDKYVGMDRERFIKAMDTYAASPPLSELERGFAGLEVLSFSREKVVIEMDYRYVQPGESFYLALIDHQVVVYLEDQSTIYINTGISANMLSEELREQMSMEMIYVEDERKLYDFLESYSS